IAAGEVVERPSSVAKELLENAIDAGASAVVVELERGGLTYLRITDNGCGMTRQQLPVAFLRHATSKLRTAEDLAAIGTLGFRGEALAAISAVSRVDVYSRTPGAPEGAMLHLEGGVPGRVEAAGCPEGTTICVRDLFYNTPARMKFMKKDTAEATAVANVVTHLALSHPDISFKLLRDGQETLHTPGDGQLLSAVYAALGRDFAKSLLPIHGAGGDVSADGFITAPLAGHGTRARQIFFVNGRLVKSQLLQAALEEAYRNRLLKGKFPGCVIHVTLPHDMVDVNVHPAKTVVKFAAEKAVFDAVYYTVKDALDAENRPAAPAPQREFYRTMTAEEYRAAAAEQAKKPLGSYGAKSAALPLHDVAPAPGQPFTAPAPQGRQYVITPPPEHPQPSPWGEGGAAQRAVTDEGAAPSQLPIEPPQPSPTGGRYPSAHTGGNEGAITAQLSIDPPAPAPWRIVGEVLKTYIICEDDGGSVWLIDKHAAHERIRFDALKENPQPLMSQTLLLPLTVTLEADDYDAALANLPALAQFGFQCEDFGGGTILLRAIPADIRMEDAAATVEELAHKLALGRADPAAARDELLHTMACKSAIKAGMTTDPAEWRVLVDKVQSGAIQYCPHGRPVKYRLSRYEIEKFFKRA
ncbi:MAG: DNA mismatch repair endonuclease MutL, partial [Oscillospiraceae bacterium]|nr:DNA mismatch repair endonuclease MutL [Oscillospiraceae bacterium]